MIAPPMELAAAEDAFKNAVLFGEPLPLPALQTLTEACRHSAAADDPAAAPPPNLVWVGEGGPDEARRNLEVRLQRLAARAAEQTAHYGALFARLGLNPAELTLDTLSQLPVLTKDQIRAAPYDFVCRDIDVAYRTHTSGTGGGKPLGLCFSEREIAFAAHLTAISCLLSKTITSEDIYLIPASNRQVLSGTTAALGLHLIGAAVFWSWLSRPEITLAHLAETHHMPGKRPKITRMQAHPSHLAEMVTAGLATGYGRRDFALRQIDAGGELLTDGLRRRAAELWGDDMTWYDGYGMSETWGSGGSACPEGNMHFEYTGYWEFLDPETHERARNGDIATCVATVLPPFRETTLFMRYDTEDLLRPLASCPCGLGGQVTTRLLGKRYLSVKHAEGWTTPRDVLEALEDLDAVPLPARCGFWAEDGGVAVEVVAPSEARAAVGDALEARGVPLRRLALHDTRDTLERPYPLRVDLR